MTHGCTRLSALGLLWLTALSCIVLPASAVPTDGVNAASAASGGRIRGPRNASGSAAAGAAAIDGDVSTYGPNSGYMWAYAATPTVVTFAEPHVIERLEVYFLDLDRRAFRYRLEGTADGGTWTALVDATDRWRRGRQEHRIDTTLLTAIRLVITATTVPAGSYHLVELAAWKGLDADSASPLASAWAQARHERERRRRDRAAIIGLAAIRDSVFEHEPTMAEGRTLPEADVLRRDTDGDGDIDLLIWREGSMVVAGVDEDDDMTTEDQRPDTDSDCWVVDYRGDSTIDRVIDYNDEDGDQDLDTVVLYLLTANIWSRRDMTCVVMKDLDDDNLTWRFHRYEYQQGLCQWDCDFAGDEFFCMARYDENAGAWVSRFENPFCFYDLDRDGDSEVAIRYSGNGLRLRSLRYSLDVDNDATPTQPKDYDMSVTALGTVQVPAEFAEETALRGGKRLPHVGWRQARELAEWAPWQRALLCWDEDDNNVNPRNAERVHERWEGVIAHGSRFFPQEGGPSAGPFNKRYEVDNDFSGRMGLYYSGVDHRIHLRGAERGWISADVDYDGRPDLRIDMEDSDGNGFFDRWAVDVDADGQAEQTTTVPDEKVRLLSWNHRDLRRAFLEGLNSAEAFHQRIAAGDEITDTAPYRYWTRGLPGFYAAEKLLASREAARLYRDLSRAATAGRARGSVPLLDDDAREAPEAVAAVALTHAAPFRRENEPVVLTWPPDLLSPGRIGQPTAAIGDPARPVQLDDTDTDGRPNEAVFLATLDPGESRVTELVLGPRRSAPVSWRTSANAHMGLSLGWESDLVAFRTYDGKIDVFGKREPGLVLRSLHGAYHREAEWGMDILHVGLSVGLGGIVLWKDDVPFRLLNETTRRGMVIGKRVIAVGPLRSLVETTLTCDDTPYGPLTITRRWQILAGQQHTEETLTVHLEDAVRGTVVLGPGLMKLHTGVAGQGQNGMIYLWAWGTQDHPDVAGAGPVGLALLLQATSFVDVVETDLERCVRCRVRSGESMQVVLAATWAKAGRFSDADGWSSYVHRLAARCSNPVRARITTLE